MDSTPSVSRKHQQTIDSLNEKTLADCRRQLEEEDDDDDYDLGDEENQSRPSRHARDRNRIVAG